MNSIGCLTNFIFRNLMTNITPRIMTIFLTATLFTGGIVPFSFANDYDDDDYYECEVPSIFSVMYNGPDNISVEIYKQPKHAKNSEKLVHSYSQSFNDGEYIILNSETDLDREQIKTRTTYKIMDGSSEIIIPINTSCKRPLSVGDVHEKDGITLTVMSGTDLDYIPVIFEKYHYETGDDSQTCNDGQIIDFGSLSNGASHDDVVTYFEGLGIEYTVDANNSLDESSIYDSTTSGGADPDLEDPQPTNGEIKNLLIIAEQGSTQPDDEGSGGTHILEFENPSQLKSLRVIDIEENENPATITGFLADNSGTLSVTMEITGNDMQRLMDETDLGDLANADINKLKIMLPSSGAVTNLCIEESEPPIQNGAIVINKITDPSEIVEQVFDFTFRDSSGTQSFQLDTDSTTSEIPNTEEFGNLPPEMQYTVKETSLTGFTSSVECSSTGTSMITYSELEATITLAEGDIVTCNYTNEQIGMAVDPTMTLYKLVINNGTPGNGLDFGLMIDGITVTNGTTFTAEANIPFTISEAGLVQYEFVEIRGDGHCPENLGGTITLSEGQHIECFIVNQPDSISEEIEPGVIFYHNTLQTDLSSGAHDNCVTEGFSEFPCILVPGQGVADPTVLDPALTTPTTIVTYVVTGDFTSGITAQCPFIGLTSINTPVGPINGFQMDCSSGSGVFNINFALIEANPNP